MAKPKVVTLAPEIEKNLQEMERKNPNMAETFRRVHERIAVEEDVNRLFKTIGENPKELPAEPQLPAVKTAKIIQLPLFPHEQAGTPDCFLRSAVFAATDRDRKHFKRPTEVSAVAGYTIKFKGDQLTQHHLVVWEALVKLAKLHPLGDECRFIIHRFLKSNIGYKGAVGKAAYEKICFAFTDLRACAIEVYRGRKRVFGGGPIDSYLRDDETGEACIRLNPELIQLFGKGMWSTLQWEQRLALKQFPLALWLHGFYSSHAKPLPYKVETLKELSGSNITALREFRRSLKKALDQLQKVGSIMGWSIGKGDLVRVERAPSRSQAKALIPALKD